MVFHSLLQNGTQLSIYGGTTRQQDFYYVDLNSFAQTYGWARFMPDDEVVGSHNITSVTAEHLRDVGLHLRAFGDNGFALDSFRGSAQNDNVEIVQTEDVTVWMGDGNDLIKTHDGDDTIHLGQGNDTAVIYGGSNLINGGNGIDQVQFRGSISNVEIEEREGILPVWEVRALIDGTWQSSLLVGVERVDINGEIIQLPTRKPLVEDSGYDDFEDEYEIVPRDWDKSDGDKEADLDWADEIDWAALLGAEDPVIDATLAELMPASLYDLSRPAGLNSDEKVVKGQGDLDARFQHPEDGGPNWALPGDVPVDDMIWA